MQSTLVRGFGFFFFDDASLTTKESNSSRAPGPQEFVLGAGSVLPAWELAAPTMLVGELCELLVAPEHAYGEEGASHLGVPPKCALAFRVELLDWKEARVARETLDDDARFVASTIMKLYDCVPVWNSSAFRAFRCSSDMPFLERLARNASASSMNSSRPCGDFCAHRKSACSSVTASFPSGPTSPPDMSA